MSTLLQVCFVIVTMAVAAIAVAVIMVMQQFRKASYEFARLSEEGRELIDRLDLVARDAGEIVGTFREVAPRVRRVVEHIEAIGERTVNLSDAVIQEVEAPLRTAIAVARGVRFGTRQLVEYWMERFTHRAAGNGGELDE